MPNTSANFIRIAITGGPGAGKTSALETLANGWSQFPPVEIASEAATMLINAGATPWTFSKEEERDFQIRHVGLQLQLEAEAERRLLARGEPAGVVLCDRGLMDGAAYHGLEGWDKVLMAHAMTKEDALNRYAAVIHLETSAALGDLNYPGRANPARWQDVEGAKKSDLALRQVWAGHENHIVIPAGEHFSMKLAALKTVLGEVANNLPRHEPKTHIAVDEPSLPSRPQPPRHPHALAHEGVSHRSKNGSPSLERS